MQTMGKPPMGKPPTLVSRGQPMLVPSGRTGQNTRNVRERTKLPRLHRADFYVTRLGWKAESAPDASSICCGKLGEDADVKSPSRPSTGSLYEELVQPGRAVKPTAQRPSAIEEKRPSVLTSRPCYRCISYMASVGIKRVFWTTDSGWWEGAKVRDLVDALDNLALESSSGTGIALRISSLTSTRY